VEIIHTVSIVLTAPLKNQRLCYSDNMKVLLAVIVNLIFFLVLSSPTQAQIYTTEKLITVNLGSQTLTAWEDAKVVHQTKVSTGLKLTPTVKGSFKIYYKTPLHDMRGPSPYKNIYPSGRYHIKNVPHSLYFYQGYAIHGAYWHNNFGRVASHGCVNVPLASAQWLYNFADVGTRVEVF
jgi:lipoprotein-anchoring transpeptidase ErfK/SrfK